MSTRDLTDFASLSPFSTTPHRAALRLPTR
jgi:hypothetical protein